MPDTDVGLLSIQCATYHNAVVLIFLCLIPDHDGAGC